MKLANESIVAARSKAHQLFVKGFEKGGRCVRWPCGTGLGCCWPYDPILPAASDLVTMLATPAAVPVAAILREMDSSTAYVSEYSG
jgi:hypothetical protein